MKKFCIYNFFLKYIFLYFTEPLHGIYVIRFIMFIIIFLYVNNFNIVTCLHP